MYLILLIIIVFTGVAIYIGSAFAVMYRWDENNVPFNISMSNYKYVISTVLPVS